MSRWRYLLRTLMHHWRINGTVALSVAAATAVLVGALLIGDSVRESLRRLTLDRLGRIDEALITDHFFRADLVQELASDAEFSQVFAAAAPAILFPSATVEKQTAELTSRAAGVQIIGCEESFWSLGDAASRPGQLPGAGEIVLNEVLAEQLGAAVGDAVVLRLPKSSQVPADSPLANKADRIRSLAGLRVVSIIPARSLGQFQLRPSQLQPRNAYVSLATIQDALGEESRINAILVSGKQPELAADAARSEAASRVLAQALRPALGDYGMKLKRVRRTFPATDAASGQMVYDYYSLMTDRMIFSPESERAVRRAIAPHRGIPLFTYVVNSLQKLNADGVAEPTRIPYSMVTAIDVSDAFPLADLAGQRIGPLEDGQIVLTQWAASDLEAQAGDRLRIEYFAPETTHGQAREQNAELVVRAVTPLTEPATPYRRNREAVYESLPTLANDPDLTPEVKGVTDQETIEDWDAPFPIDYTRVRAVDDDFWANHRTTPKGYVSTATGERLWGNRFGRVTAFRIPAQEGLSAELLEAQLVHELSPDAAAIGFAFVPIKRQQLAASQGTTPFDALFLALSFFIIAAALMLVALLFRLGVEQRAEELGTLLAVGFRRRGAASLLLLEAAAVAAVGGLAGLVIGIGYARLMLYGLRTWWLGAITAPFVEYHATSRSLLLGYGLGVLVCLATILWSMAALRGVSIRRLLAGRMAEGAVLRGAARWPRWLAGLLLVAALTLLVTAAGLAGMPQAGAFVGGGASLLAALLVSLWSRLKGGGTTSRVADMGLAGLAWRNAARNPTRSVITMGLIATASFLIVATSSFRLAPTDTGVGGFQLVAESSEPLFGDLNSPAVRDELFADRAAMLQGSTVFGLRLRAGDDASCNNLYQPSQPRVLGITPEFTAHFDEAGATPFAWSSTAAESDRQRANPWHLLGGERRATDDAIPTVIDMNTAFYSLKPPATLGSVYEATYEAGRPLRFRIVGLLENSLLQGSLMIGEPDFERYFPEVSGYRYFLIKTPLSRAGEVRQILEDRLGDEGFDAEPADAVLAQLLAVQNAYLSTFQSLGALGLLFGTFGLATVQLRNVMERRGELALLRATGFDRRQLARLVLYENASLLAVGLAAGVFAALLAVVPHKSFGEASVPWSLLRDLGLMLAGVFAIGVLASLASVRAALHAPLLQALRQD